MAKWKTGGVLTGGNINPVKDPQLEKVDDPPPS